MVVYALPKTELNDARVPVPQSDDRPRVWEKLLSLPDCLTLVSSFYVTVGLIFAVDFGKQLSVRMAWCYRGPLLAILMLLMEFICKLLRFCFIYASVMSYLFGMRLDACVASPLDVTEPRLFDRLLVSCLFTGRLTCLFICWEGVWKVMDDLRLELCDRSCCKSLEPTPGVEYG